MARAFTDTTAQRKRGRCHVDGCGTLSPRRKRIGGRTVYVCDTHAEAVDVTRSLSRGSFVADAADASDRAAQRVAARHAAEIATTVSVIVAADAVSLTDARQITRDMALSLLSADDLRRVDREASRIRTGRAHTDAEADARYCEILAAVRMRIADRLFAGTLVPWDAAQVSAIVREACSGAYANTDAASVADTAARFAEEWDEIAETVADDTAAIAYRFGGSTLSAEGYAVLARETAAMVLADPTADDETRALARQVLAA